MGIWNGSINYLVALWTVNFDRRTSESAVIEGNATFTMEVTAEDAVRNRRTTSRQSSRELLHPALEDLDPSTRFLYTPHTITGLLIGATV